MGFPEGLGNFIFVTKKNTPKENCRLKFLFLPPLKVNVFTNRFRPIFVVRSNFICSFSRQSS